MRRSFEFGGSNMSGGRGGSVQTIRSIQRGFRAGGEGIYRSPLNSITTTSTVAAKYTDNNKNKSGSNSTVLTLSSSSPLKTTVGSVLASSTWPSCPSPALSDDSDWENITDIENDTAAQPCFDDVIFGRTPSTDEVRRAFYSLQGFLDTAGAASSEYSIYERSNSYSDKNLAYQITSPTSSVIGDSPSGGEPDWEEPSLNMCNSSWSPSRISQGNVYEALTLVQNDSDIQQIMESLSTDEAVWDAVKNNEVVRKFRSMYYQADNISVKGSNGDVVDSNGALNILNRLVNKVKSKIMELMQNITSIFNELLHQPEGEGRDDAERNSAHFAGKVQLSVFVTFLVFLMVVLQRMKPASNSSAK